MRKITAIVLRGKHKGTSLHPHRFADGTFQVSLGSNLVADAIRVEDESELESWILKGYGVRMSGIGVAPSIYTAKSLIVIEE